MDISDSMETLDEAKNYIRFLYALVLEKNSREGMLMKEKDAETIIHLLANIEPLMDELSEARVVFNNMVSIYFSQSEQISVLKKHCYGRPSQRKGISKNGD